MPDSFRNLATTLSRAGRHDQALAALDDATAALVLSGKPDSPDAAGLLVTRGGILRERGDFAGARAAVRTAVERLDRLLGPAHPMLIDPLLTLADIEGMAGQHDAAVAAARRAEAILVATHGAGDANLAPVRAFLGQMLVASGRPADAVVVLEPALARWLASGGSPLITGQIQLTLADALWQARGERARARGLAEDAAASLRPTGAAGAAELAKVEAWLAAHAR